MTHEPSPSRSLHSSSLGVDCLLQVLQATKVPLDRLSKLATGGKLGLFRLVRSQILPEKRVVNVSAPVELQGGLKSDSGLDGLGSGFLGLELGEGFLSGVETVNVGLVVLGVVQGHDLLGDAGLQGLKSGH